MGSLLFYPSILVIASVFVWKGGGLPESSAEALTKHCRLCPIIQGSIITAVGSSFPELSTVLLIVMLLRKSQLSRREGWILIGVYGIFALWISLESFTIVDWIGK